MGVVPAAECAQTLRDVQAFIRIPSVSSQPRHAPDVQRCAAWLGAQMRGIGLEHVAVTPTARHPIVYGDWLHAPGQPTVLIYGHYDVQPADPVSAWTSPPFAAAIQGDYLLGRGATDNKGQLFAHLEAMRRTFRARGRLPVNVRCLFEGEEEIGSPSLPAFLHQHRRQLAADVAVISDTRMLGPRQPALTYALRGHLTLELEVRGAARELHSGTYGGAIHNPLHALCDLIARLHGRDGRVTIPGFYDRVRRWDPAERAFMARWGPSDARLLAEAGAMRAWGERGFSLYERTTTRPAVTVSGIAGGYTGPGIQGVIPPRAMARIGIRLVPNQDPLEIDELFREQIVRVTPPTVKATTRTIGMARPAVIDRRHPAMRAAARAYREGFGADPVYLRSGGTIPVVALLQESLGIPTVLMGFALPDARMHAPDERLHLPTFFRSVRTCERFLDAIATMRETPAGVSRRAVMAVR